MYSALRAEVPVEDDQATKMNMQLINVLKKHSKVVVCGQALSHCVSNTMRDLLSCWPLDRASDLILLCDGCSNVPGFEEAGDRFVADMNAAGCTVCTAEELYKILE
jgi:nicotinamidase-related amidase